MPGSRAGVERGHRHDTSVTPNVTYTDQYAIFAVGAGYLDIAAALNNADLATATAGAAMSPIANYDATTGQVYLVMGNSVMWGSSVVWGTSVVCGSSVIWGANATGQSVLWGNSVCWGSSTNAGFSVIWGSSVVWGSKTNSDAMTVAIGGEK